MVRILLSYGANPGATTMRRLSSLHLAAHEGHLKISRFLLEAWAPVDNRDVAGSTPLHLAAKKGHAEIVRLLLQCGADKDWAEQSGWTALHFAVWNGHARVARALLQAGANAKVSNVSAPSCNQNNYHFYISITFPSNYLGTLPSFTSHI